MTEITPREVSWSEWKTYYRTVKLRWRDNWREHFWARVFVSFATAALAGGIAWLAGAGPSSLFYAFGGFGAWIAFSAVFFRWRAPIELNRERTAERDSALVEVASLEAERALDREIRLEPLTRAPAQLFVRLREDEQDVVGQEIWLVHFPIFNHGRGSDFTAMVLDQSVTGLQTAYPDGSFLLRWQTPNESDRQPIPRDMDARIDVAWVIPALNSVRFLGPGTMWAQHRVADDAGGHVKGTIVVAAVGRDASQRFHFEISMGNVDPIGIKVEPV